MATDDLNKPLGLPRERKAHRTPLVALVAPPLLIAIGLIAFFAFGDGQDDPGNVVAAIDDTSPDQTGSVGPALTPVYEAQSEPLVEVKPTGGLREVRGNDVIISDPSKPRPIRLAAAPFEDLIEADENGLLPRIGDDGTRPLDAYARPAGATEGMKRIAIVVGGIGIEGEAGQSAIASLPGEVTLGIVPYGEDLPATVAEARALGHEILLQLPMEPYNYPDIDPGPNTLTVAGGTAKNLDRLRWLLAQTTTYVGVMNYMGARFTGDDRALAPILGDIANRGLLFLDDGSSARSRVGAFASDSAPVIRADLVLDGDTAPAAIDARIKQLVAIAKERGYAVATATAFPSTIARISAFARVAEENGIALVPVSSLVRADGS